MGFNVGFMWDRKELKYLFNLLQMLIWKLFLKYPKFLKKKAKKHKVENIKYKELAHFENTLSINNILEYVDNTPFFSSKMFEKLFQPLLVFEQVFNVCKYALEAYDPFMYNTCYKKTFSVLGREFKRLRSLNRRYKVLGRSLFKFEASNASMLQLLYNKGFVTMYDITFLNRKQVEAALDRNKRFTLQKKYNLTSTEYYAIFKFTVQYKKFYKQERTLRGCFISILSEINSVFWVGFYGFLIDIRRDLVIKSTAHIPLYTYIYYWKTEFMQIKWLWVKHYWWLALERKKTKKSYSYVVGRYYYADIVGKCFEKYLKYYCFYRVEAATVKAPAYGKLQFLSHFLLKIVTKTMGYPNWCTLLTRQASNGNFKPTFRLETLKSMLNLFKELKKFCPTEIVLRTNELILKALLTNKECMVTLDSKLSEHTLEYNTYYRLRYISQKMRRNASFLEHSYEISLVNSLQFLFIEFLFEYKAPLEKIVIIYYQKLLLFFYKEMLHWQLELQLQCDDLSSLVAFDALLEYINYSIFWFSKKNNKLILMGKIKTPLTYYNFRNYYKWSDLLFK